MKVLKCLPKEPQAFVHWTPDVTQDEIATWLGSLDEVEHIKTGTYGDNEYVRFRTTLDITDAVYTGGVVVLDVGGYPEVYSYPEFAIEYVEVTHEQ